MTASGGLNWTQRRSQCRSSEHVNWSRWVTGTDCTGEYGCPGVYKTDRGDLAVQGRLLQPGELPSGAVIPAGEAFVEIPRELLLAAARRFTEGGQAS